MSAPAARPTQAIKLYRFALSGHCHRVELMLALLRLPYTLIDLDFLKGAHKTPEFLAMNSFGQLPIIQDGAETIADSNAILVYLASRYGDDSWLPREPVRAAAVQRWLSVAAGQVAFGPAAARLVTLLNAPFQPQEVIGRAHTLFAVMEQELQGAEFLTGTTPTIADIANYTYIALAPEGNVSLAGYPQVRAWLQRVEQLPGFVPMKKTPIGLVA
jgi:glutathione S-transferase